MSTETPRVGYVLKVYPRFSETFVVNELLAHERAGADLSIFSLRPPLGGRIHPDVGEVAAPVTYLPSAGLRAGDHWQVLRAEARRSPAGRRAVAALAADPDADSARDVLQAVLLAGEVRAKGIAHLHAHFASCAATVARLAARLAGITWSVTAHAKDIFHEDVDPGLLALRLADARAVVTVSDFNLEHLRTVAPGATVHRVYNGMDLRRFRFRPPVDRAPSIVAVGRLVEKKGFADLVEACALLAREGRDAPCRIVGEGPEEPALRAAIVRHGLEERVELLGPRTQDEVRRLVREAAVMAAPCVVGEDGNRDGMPTVLLEALALGTPGVATDVTGIPELIRHEETGLLVGQHDPPALAAAIARLLDDRVLRGRLAAAGRGLVEREFDVEHSAAEVRRLAWPGAPARPAARAAVGATA